MRKTPLLRPGSRVLWILLSASLLLRVALVLSGGQNYWPDELRYGRSRAAVDAFAKGDWSSGRAALAHPDHFLFSVLGLAPAAIERAVGPNPRIPALFFAFFSVASIFLLFVLMLRLRESPRAALLAALLLALTTTHLYYSRHLLPYDTAMAFGLSSLVAGFRTPVRVRDSAACGLLASATLLTYNGFWVLAVFALATHAAREPRTSQGVARRAAVAGGVFVLAVIALVGIDAAAGDDLGRRWITFSSLASQGSFEEGWSLPLAYFWHAEHLIAVLWVWGVLWGIVRLSRGNHRPALVLGLAGLLVVYGSLVVTSVVLRRMVVYGRLAKPLAPFACIVTGLMLEELFRRRRALAAGVLTSAAVQAIANFYLPLTQVFPAEFRALAAAVPNPTNQDRRLVFAEHIYPFPFQTPQDAGVVLLARRHPLQYRPYQYEGYSPAERDLLRATDIRMRLVTVREDPVGPSPHRPPA